MDRKVQPLAVVLAIALVLAAVFVPELFGNAPAPEPVTIFEPVIDQPEQGTEGDQTQTDGQEVVVPGDGSDGIQITGGSEEDGSLTGSPGADDATEGEHPSTEQDPAPPLPTVPDDGIELEKGITDARAEQAAAAKGVTVRKNGTYTSKVEVALYIHTYGRVPSNYITKTKARNAGWEASEGNLWDVLPGMSIGGGGYINEQWGDEPLLPETRAGREWRECDINYKGGFRGAERLVYSDDGLIFYTGDHYSTFERLY